MRDMLILAALVAVGYFAGYINRAYISYRHRRRWC